MDENRIVKDGLIYYNGAEQYQEGDWVLFSNYGNTHGIEVDITVKHTGLICRINPYTTDRFGNDLPDSFALELPAEFGLSEQETAINQKFELARKLGEKYKQLFYEQGIVPEGYFNWKRLCYIGCEQEYGLPKPILKK